MALFEKKALLHADVVQFKGDATVTFAEIQSLTPRYSALQVCCHRFAVVSNVVLGFDSHINIHFLHKVLGRCFIIIIGHHPLPYLV